MKKLLSAVLLSAMIVPCLAQEKTNTERITLELTTGMIEAITVEDFATKPCRWTFSYLTDNEDDIKMFVRTLGNKENRRFSYAIKDETYYCVIEENQVFTGESLYKLIQSREEVAAACHMSGVKAFGLTNPPR
jgi:hypothetical protein